MTSGSAENYVETLIPGPALDRVYWDLGDSMCTKSKSLRYNLPYNPGTQKWPRHTLHTGGDLLSGSLGWHWCLIPEIQKIVI